MGKARIHISYGVAGFGVARSHRMVSIRFDTMYLEFQRA